MALMKHKKWMREPSAHGIMDLLASLAKSSNSGRGGRGNGDIFLEVVKSIVVPRLIVENSAEWSDVVDSMSAEQIGLCLHIQTLTSDMGCATKLPEPLNAPLLTPEMIPAMSKALRDTSEIVHPRRHLVWNAIWSYLT